MKASKNIKQFRLSVEDADGPIQLCLMNDKRGSGKRLLGSKGSPFRRTLKEWNLSKDELRQLLKDIREVMV